jgi:hypothetical protein
MFHTPTVRPIRLAPALVALALGGSWARAQAAPAPDTAAPDTAALRAEVGTFLGGRLVRAADGALVARFGPWRGTAPAAAALAARPAAAPDARVFRANWAPGWWAGTAGVALGFAGAYGYSRLGRGPAVGVTAGGLALTAYGLAREFRGRRALERAVARYNASAPR